LIVTSAKQIRNGFIDFFRDKGHEFVPSSPIVPVGDDTLLFANAGMNQFKDIFLGLAAPSYRRVANSQKCLRVSGKHNDLEEVGKDTYHHTFFEMLGNWSFDDYFKAEAIEWAWELLTKVWGIEADRLWASVFAGDPEDGLPKDQEAERLWSKVTSIPAERVLAFGKKDNFWEMGETGPCGPCSEIHIDLGPERCDKKDVPGHKCVVNGGCARFIELWNLVFIQFNRTDEGRLVELGAKYVDTGAGLERIAAVMQGKHSNYDTDLFMPIIERISELTGQKYTSQLGETTDNAFRVIADHVRAVVFAITDGAIPSNEGRGYVIRRILRRASRFGRQLGMHEPFIYKLVPVVAEVMGGAFGEIKQREDYVSMVVESEEASFGRTLDRGLEIFTEAAEKARKRKNKTIGGEDAFQLYDTYGFPLDLTQLMAEERGLKVDTAGFDKLMDEQRKRAQAAQKVDSIPNLLNFAGLSPTDDSLKYKTDTCESVVTSIIDLEDKSNIKVGSISSHSTQEYGLVLKETCFYAKAGGQVGDCGIIKSDSGDFVVETTEKLGETVIHWGKVAIGSFTTGTKVTASVDKNRENTKKNHTATHLLQWALRQVLGDTVTQQGSLVCADYLRFDFTHSKALPDKEKKRVEYLVREKITEDLPVTCTVLPKLQAYKLGAMALFGEKYGEDVRVVAVGAPDEKGLYLAYSKEFCGGTHVDRLGPIGGFKIIKEESIAAGVRRITALTGVGLNDYLEKRGEIVDKLSEMLKVPAEEVADRVEKLLQENKRLAKELKSGGGADVMAEARQLLEGAERIAESYIVAGRLSAASSEQGRAAIDMLRKKTKSAAVVLGFAEGDKATVVAGVTDDLVKRGLSAGDVIKAIAPIIKGGGGGRPQMAQAGGKSPEKIDDALAKAKELIKEKLQSPNPPN
jgi:alanyl-tRNA synthetase